MLQSDDNIWNLTAAFGRNKFLKFIDLIDATVNPTACLQQYFCLLSEQSAINLAEGCATSSDKIIAGIFE